MPKKNSGAAKETDAPKKGKKQTDELEETQPNEAGAVLEETEESTTEDDFDPNKNADFAAFEDDFDDFGSDEDDFDEDDDDDDIEEDDRDLI